MKEKVGRGGYIRTIPLGIVQVNKRIMKKDGSIEYKVHTKHHPSFEWIMPNSLCRYEVDEEDYNKS